MTDYNSKLVGEYNIIMNKIGELFKPYVDMLVKRANGMPYVIGKEFEDELYDILIHKSHEELRELNDLTKSFSNCNCWWVTYEVAKEIRNQIAKIYQ